MRLGGVQAHAHPHGIRGDKRTLRGHRGDNGIGCALEDDEESVAPGIDLASTMGR